MDVFVEQIVKKPADGKSIACKILIGAGTGLITVISLYLMLMGIVFALLIIFGAIYAGYFFITNFDVEYEYIVTNGEMDIDKIIAKRKRKRLITAKASSFEWFGRLSDAPEVKEGVTVIKADGIPFRNAETEVCCADFSHPSIGAARLIFSPEKKVIEGLKPFLSRNTRAEFERSFRSE